jgi:probable rRNA maturation factor
MRLKVVVANVSSESAVPQDTAITQWARAAMEGHENEVTEVDVRIVDEHEIAELNRRFRNKPEATNVLSFPFEDPPGVHTGLLGDVVICAPVVCREAQRQGKQVMAHWAHMLVHGIMHLRGYDHETPREAQTMEGMETSILTRLGFPNPYA